MVIYSSCDNVTKGIGGNMSISKDYFVRCIRFEAVNALYLVVFYDSKEPLSSVKKHLILLGIEKVID